MSEEGALVTIDLLYLSRCPNLISIYINYFFLGSFSSIFMCTMNILKLIMRGEEEKASQNASLKNTINVCVITNAAKMD